MLALKSVKEGPGYSLSTPQPDSSSSEPGGGDSGLLQIFILHPFLGGKNERYRPCESSPTEEKARPSEKLAEGKSHQPTEPRYAHNVILSGHNYGGTMVGGLVVWGGRALCEDVRRGRDGDKLSQDILGHLHIVLCDHQSLLDVLVGVAQAP